MLSEVCLAVATSNKRHNMPQIPGLSEHVCYLVSSREKQVLSILEVTANKPRISTWSQEVPL